ncbi:MAG: helix-turn-helix domain-containing protein [Candidatus Limnocylindria bacterium]
MTRSSSSRRRAHEQATRIGAEVHVARTTLALSGQHVAARAGVSWSTLNRVELGDPGVSVSTMCAVAESVGLDLVLRAYPGATPSLRDTGQLAIAERIGSQAAASWRTAIEMQVGPHGEAIDMVIFGAHEIWAVEIERMAADFQAQRRRADRKREMLADRHRRPVRLVMVVEDTRRNRRAIEPHLELIRGVFPAGSREILRSLRGGAALGKDGLLWIRPTDRRHRTR